MSGNPNKPKPARSAKADNVFDGLLAIGVPAIRGDLEAAYTVMMQTRINHMKACDHTAWLEVRDKAQSALNITRLNLLILLRRVFLQEPVFSDVAHPKDLAKIIRDGTKVLIRGKLAEESVEKSIAMYGDGESKEKLMAMLQYEPNHDDERKSWTRDSILRTSDAIIKSIKDSAISLSAVGFVEIKYGKMGSRNVIEGIKPTQLGLSFCSYLIGIATKMSFGKMPLSE